MYALLGIDLGTTGVKVALLQRMMGARFPQPLSIILFCILRLAGLSRTRKIGGKLRLRLFVPAWLEGYEIMYSQKMCAVLVCLARCTELCFWMRKTAYYGQPSSGLISVVRRNAVG